MIYRKANENICRFVSEAYVLSSSLLVPQSGSGLPGHVFSSRSYFFDNPRRYDSDDDLAWSVMPQNIQAR